MMSDNVNNDGAERIYFVFVFFFLFCPPHITIMYRKAIEHLDSLDNPNIIM